MWRHRFRVELDRRPQVGRNDIAVVAHRGRRAEGVRRPWLRTPITSHAPNTSRMSCSISNIVTPLLRRRGGGGQRKTSLSSTSSPAAGSSSRTTCVSTARARAMPTSFCCPCESVDGIAACEAADPDATQEFTDAGGACRRGRTRLARSRRTSGAPSRRGGCCVHQIHTVLDALCAARCEIGVAMCGKVIDVMPVE